MAKTTDTAKSELTPRARRRAARIQSILDTAMELIVDDGLPNLTVHKLARELDITAGALYRYFDSKDAILAELQVTVIRRFHGLFEIAWAATDKAAEDADADVATLAQLVVTAEAFVELIDTRPRRFRLLSQVLAEPEPLVADEAFATVMAPALALLLDVATRFDRALTAGVLDSAALSEPASAMTRAVLLWGSLQGVAQMQKLTRTGDRTFERRPLARTSTEIFFLGQGAGREVLDAAYSLVDGLPLGTLLADTPDVTN